jgi:cation transport regulator ChaC
VESDQDQHYSSADDQSRDAIPSPESEPYEAGETTEMGPGVSVVRGNTPRPLPFEALLAASGQGAQEQAATRSVFPGQAPAAPPLPEELEDDEQASSNAEVAMMPENATGPQEFIWLFEYGMEMEVAFLNSPERLAGAAFLYGPAVLQGYTLMFAEIPQTGQFLGTIVPSPQPKAEVWGVLYRVPRRVTARNDKQLSLLDSVHAAGTSTSLFAPVSVMVRETYHEREISCGTYALTTTVRQQLRLFTPEQADAMTLLVRHIALLARKQKLPSYYLNLSSQPASVELPAETQKRRSDVATPLPREQNTDPIPVLKEKNRTATTNVQDAAVHSFSRWLVALAFYQILVLLLILVFAVLQGMGLMSSFLTPNLQLLGVPWLLLIYGMLGGTVSSVVALARARRIHQPLFAIILWFVRPYIGGVLALFAYLLLNSGLFTLVDIATSHITLLPLIGALAGLCEGWLFTRLR